MATKDNIKLLAAYIVTKESTDKTFQNGDIIWLSENGDMNMLPGGSYKQCGWLERREWDVPQTNDFEAEPTEDYEIRKTESAETIVKTG